MNKFMSPITMILIGTLVTVIGAIVTAIGTYRQHLASSEKSSKILELSEKNNELAEENKHVVEKSRDSLMSHINSELADFGIRYDASNERFEKILKEGVAKPVLTLCPDKGVQFISHENNLLKLRISVCSFEAACSNVNLKLRSLTLNSANRFAVVNKGDVSFDPDTLLPPGTAVATEVHIFNDQAQFDKVYILVRGSYWDVGKKFEQKVESVLEYDVKSKSWAYSNGERRTQALDAFSKHK